MNSERLVVGAGLLALALVSWALVVLNVGPMMGMPGLPIESATLLFFVVTWTIGMVAMMFPTAVPMLLMFLHMGKNASEEVKSGGGPTTAKALLFVATYISFWVAMGVALYVAIALVIGQLPMEANVFIGTSVGLGAALILVAVYQLSPIKGECLSRCHPTSFLYKYYRGGLLGSVRMGADYAKYCIGCCWVMMAFLIVSASMGVAWMAAFAGIIFVERTFTLRRWMPRLFGVGFLIGGVALVLAR